MLFAGYVHLQMKSRHKYLLHKINTSRITQSRIKLNNFSKKFENLEVFTVADVFPITFNSYRGVSCAAFVRLPQVLFYSSSNK